MTSHPNHPILALSEKTYIRKLIKQFFEIAIWG